MSLGPFDLTGGPFLTLYGVLLVLTVIAGFIIPRWLRPDGSAMRITDPEKLAFLAGGKVRLADAVVSRLLAGDAVSLIGKKAFAAAPGAEGHSFAERNVLAVATGLPAGWSSVERSIAPQADTIERELVSAGLMMDQPVTGQMRFWQTSPYLVLLAFGAIKVVVGEERGRPVGFLIALLILTLFLAAIRFFVVDRRTRGGIEALGNARERSDRLRRAPANDEAGLAVALFGTGVLAGSPWSDYHALRTAGSSDGGSSSGGCGGGGGGGGGCGGCGGS